MAEKIVIRGTHIAPVKSRPGQNRYSLATFNDQNQKVWYSTFDGALGKDILALKEGDVAEIEYYQKGDFFNLVSVKKVEAQPAPAAAQDGPPDEPEESKEERSERYFKMKNTLIVAQSCLDKAIALLPYATPKEVIPPQGFQVQEILDQVYLLADGLESYVWGKLGAEEKESGVTTTETPA